MTGGILSFILAGVGMAFRDCFATIMTVAEARGRDNLAGWCDALGDGATVLTTAYGAGEVVLRGWTPHTIGVIATIMVVSYFGTRFWTRFCRRIDSEKSDHDRDQDAQADRQPDHL